MNGPFLNSSPPMPHAQAEEQIFPGRRAGESLEGQQRDASHYYTLNPSHRGLLPEGLHWERSGIWRSV